MSETRDLRRAIEALIFACDEPATPAYLRRALPSLEASRLPDLVEEINEDLRKAERPYEIARVAGGYRFRTLPEFADTILAAQPEKKLRLSRAALETLAVIAYRQPLTRPEIEELRSVDCGAVLKGLLERSMIRIVGRRDAPGRPVLYGTSSQFLETFSLASLRDLPALREIESLGEEEAGTPASEAAIAEVLDAETPEIEADAAADEASAEVEEEFVPEIVMPGDAERRALAELRVRDEAEGEGSQDVVPSAEPELEGEIDAQGEIDAEGEIDEGFERRGPADPEAASG
jgi:segregation and condensation protein B